MPRPTKQSRRRRGRDRRREFETRWRLGEFTERWQAVLGKLKGQGYKTHLHNFGGPKIKSDMTVCGRQSRLVRERPNPFDYHADGYGVCSVCKQCVTMAMRILDIEHQRAGGG